MHTTFQGRGAQRGNSATPIIVFFGIVILSVIFFFVLTLPRQMARKRQAANQPVPAAVPAATASEETAQPQSEKPVDIPLAIPARFASPRSFVQTVAAQLTAGDAKKAAELLGSEALAGERGVFFETVFGTAGFRPAPGNSLQEIGDVGELYRWAVLLGDAGKSAAPPLIPPSSAEALANTGAAEGVPPSPLDAELALRPPSSTAVPDVSSSDSAPRAIVRPRTAPAGASPSALSDDALTFEIDVTRDLDRGWKAAAVHFSEALRNRIGERLGADQVPAALASSEEEKDDPLKVAARFLKAVLAQDYAAARGVTAIEKVTREKVAGLCILFEEGDYHVALNRPLSATVAGTDSAWVIVKVHSTRDAQDSDFGIELQKTNAGAWQVAGLNFSKLLASYMKLAGAAGGAAYMPIVQNPNGGESLVVYFDFNEAGLVPRAQRQLEIVANLLRDDPNRKIRLSGHADALGTDDYNMQLSAARAFAVKSSLAALGVAAEQVVTQGFGKLQPLGPNTRPDGSDDPEGRSRNRRTEIYLDF
ncbi:MAG: OmpA family protein [Verrucomicrobiales bacterium]